MEENIPHGHVSTFSQTPLGEAQHPEYTVGLKQGREFTKQDQKCLVHTSTCPFHPQHKSYCPWVLQKQS